jgi:predicted metal-dependent phosphoesterase TrpH
MAPLISGRSLSLALLAAGLGLGAVADWIPAREPQKRGDRLVLAADFHVHGFPGDGAIGPFNLGREARRRGLDAIALTNHNQVFTARFAHWWSQRWGGTIILHGEEVTNPGYHLVALDVREAVDWRPPPAAIIAAIHAQGGLAIAAHPEPAFWPAFDEVALRELDGAERRHPLIYARPTGRAELEAFYARASASRPRPLAAIGSSDFHSAAMLGRCRTWVFARARDEAAILEAVREGQTAAHAEGEPVPADAPPVRAPAPRLGGALAWLGLLGLLLLAPVRPSGRTPAGRPFDRPAPGEVGASGPVAVLQSLACAATSPGSRSSPLVAS